MYPRSHYPVLGHEHSHASQTQPLPLIPGPSQFVQAQAAPSLPLYSQIQTSKDFSSRDFLRPSPYGSYPVAALPSQASSLSYQATYAPMYPSFATTPYHSLPAPSSYHTASPLHRQAMVHKQEAKQESWFLKGMKSLPSDVIFEIQKKVGWIDCWKAYRICQWFRENFHPNRFPEDMKLAGMLEAEQNNYGRGGSDDSDGAGSRRVDGKSPPWFGCYHCFTFKGFDRFELRKHHSSSSKEPNDAQEHDQSDSPSPRVKSGEARTPASSTALSPTPPANPHYDPSITGSSLAAARHNRRISGAVTGAGRAISNNCSDRRKGAETARRFCLDCGLRLKYYRPGDLIEVHRPPESGGAAWVCRCEKLYWRPLDIKCPVCGDNVPYSKPEGR
ncbi:hypothetical protein VTI74DRAFT_1183 [Chaetomium olivicolor]